MVYSKELEVVHPERLEEGEWAVLTDLEESLLPLVLVVGEVKVTLVQECYSERREIFK